MRGLIEMIQDDDAEALEPYVKPMPRNIFTSNLPVFAFQYNKLRCAELLLKILSQQGTAEKLEPKTLLHTVNDNPLYTYLLGQGPAHTHACSPEAFALCKRYGIDLKISTPTHGLVSNLLNAYRAADQEDTPLYERGIDAALAEGFSLNDPAPPQSKKQSLIKEFLSACVEDDSPRNYAWQHSNKLLFLARRGADLRQVALPEEKLLGEYSAPMKEGARLLLAPLQNLLREASASFLAADPHSIPRKEATLAACAGGIFPLLMHRLAKAGDDAALAEAAGYLDPFWQSQYRHSFRTASAVLARAAPLENNALFSWLSH